MKAFSSCWLAAARSRAAAAMLAAVTCLLETLTEVSAAVFTFRSIPEASLRPYTLF